MSKQIPTFRAWHKYSRRMYEVQSIAWACESNNQITWVTIWPTSADVNDCRIDEIQLMQWTGEVDQTKRQIFGGDIVQVDHEQISGITPYNAVVEFWQQTEATRNPGYYLSSIGSRGGLEPMGMAKYTVLGNIFENPGLLGQE